jgi:hypothetical protein
MEAADAATPAHAVHVKFGGCARQDAIPDAAVADAHAGHHLLHHAAVVQVNSLFLCRIYTHALYSCSVCVPWAPCNPCSCQNPCDTTTQQPKVPEVEPEPRFPMIDDLRDRLRNGLDNLLRDPDYHRNEKNQWW